MDLRFSHPAPQDFSVLDVAETMRVEMWAEKVLAVHGTPDFLINNASLMNDPAPLWEVPADKFSRLIDVKAKKGVIVNLSSGWGRSVSPKVAPYCASKWAIEGLTKALAEELPEGMAAVPLNPGIINTDMLQQCWAGEASGYPKAEAWAKKAGPFILTLGKKDNGRSVSVSEFEG